MIKYTIIIAVSLLIAVQISGENINKNKKGQINPSSLTPSRANFILEITNIEKAAQTTQILTRYLGNTRYFNDIDKMIKLLKKGCIKTFSKLNSWKRQELILKNLYFFHSSETVLNMKTPQYFFRLLIKNFPYYLSKC